VEGLGHVHPADAYIYIYIYIYNTREIQGITMQRSRQIRNPVEVPPLYYYPM
jgi:hypothetical protein